MLETTEPTDVAPALCDRLTVVLVRPTRYDDDGYVVRHWLGTLPSNTLSCLNGLTQEAAASGALHPVEVRVLTFDECVDRIDARRLGRTLRQPGTRVLVALVGVQTNQFPRAQDLARQFKAEGCDVMIGGFHVSGSVAMAHGIPPECQAMIDEGITLVLGEVEDRWTSLLVDAVRGRLRPVYDFLKDLPDLGTKPLPKVSARLQRRFAVRGYGTIDAGRGCPFNCSFCTIINVQGHAMRSRGASHIIDHIRAHYRGRRGIWHYFFTDDNFARNPSWEAIFDGLIALRHDEGLAIDFMMQVDTAASRIPGFIDKASRAGCVQVFIGMESLREDNLQAACKRQNRVGEYKASIAQWHEAGIACHVGFIIGFPFDTYDRVLEDVRTLRDELLVDQASFFMLTPLPGSRDHRAAVDAGTPMDADYNNFDSFRATMPHPLMSADAWTAAYRDAWQTFYSFDHMRQALLRQNPHTYWGMLKCFLWYRAAMIEGTHPMVTGFFRLKDRRSRRPGRPLEGRVRFRIRRLRETFRVVVGYAGLLLEMQELWLATRIRHEEYAFMGDLRALGTRATAMLEVKTIWARARRATQPRHDDGGDAAGERTAALRVVSLPPLEPRSARARLRVLRLPTLETRRALTAYWRQTARRLRRRELWRLNPVALAWNAVRDLKNLAIFVSAMTHERY